MFHRTRPFVLALFMLGTAAVTGSLSAQNFKARPTYGFVELTAGFDDAPRVFEVTAGGETNVERDLALPPACEGFINAGAPDLSINYEAGQAPFQIYVEATTDTTLIINDPFGQWQCDDDSIGLNPAKRFAQPASGQYDVWVGTFDRTRTRARVYIAEK